MSRLMRRLTIWPKLEIDRLFKQARRVYRGEGLDIAVAPKSAEYARLLIIIPKKVGSAPERNRIRRRIKAIFYEHQLYHQSRDYIFFIKPPAVALDFEQLKSIILNQVVTL